MQAPSERFAGAKIALRVLSHGTLGSTKGTFEQRLQEFMSPTPQPSFGRKLQEEVRTIGRVAKTKLLRYVPGPTTTSVPIPTREPAEIYKVGRLVRNLPAKATMKPTTEIRLEGERGNGHYTLSVTHDGGLVRIDQDGTIREIALANP